MYAEMEKEIATLHRQMRELTRRIATRLEQREHSMLTAASLRRSIHGNPIR